jgi:chromatin structure-remodeling complex subunit RSC1/2
LKKLVEKDLLGAEEAELPDLGEIPEADPLPDDDEEDEEEDEDDEEDTDDERRKKKPGPKPGSKRGGQKQEPDTRKKRGRPPRVDTPMETRIKTILKGIRKHKGSGGQLKISHFERLPDKITYPDYYMEIKEPIAIDIIKRKAKRKKYNSVDHFMRDLDLMFNNAKAYNQSESQIYKDAVDLQGEARKLAEQEKKKPDSEYLMEDGRFPLPDGILYRNELWKVGDWVHIQNPNDVSKPIVAQIYRTWQDSEDQKWINACWYYRPEQTVHHFEKHFYPNEVVKTGQYRDHRVEEIVDRCFVMFFTRYSRGRPRDLPPDKDIYVCEARYNEEKHKLNKIKTWASCLPDEVREKDYEMDLFDVPRKIKKVPSPIKHLLKSDAKETDDLPRPTWGADNAPPVVGAVHRRPRDENVSYPLWSFQEEPQLTCFSPGISSTRANPLAASATTGFTTTSHASCHSPPTHEPTDCQCQSDFRRSYGNSPAPSPITCSLSGTDLSSTRSSSPIPGSNEPADVSRAKSAASKQFHATDPDCGLPRFPSTGTIFSRTTTIQHVPHEPGSPYRSSSTNLQSQRPASN